jgi:hypothetical protein
VIEYKRKYSILNLTDLGLFHDGQLPPDYDGSVLKIEVVHRILFVNEFTGELFTMTFNPPDAKNSSKTVTPYTKDEIKLRTADVNEEHEDGNHYFPKRVKDLADFFIADIEKDGESKVI